MKSPEDIVFPPDGLGSHGRYESADMDIGALKAYFESTKFENEKNIEDILTVKYHMHRQRSIGEIEGGMTGIFDVGKVSHLMELGVPNIDFAWEPLSGKYPKLALAEKIKTIEGQTFHLNIFQIYNRNDQFRYEYVLDKITI